MKNPFRRKTKSSATRLLESGRDIIYKQGRVSIGFGDKNLTCAVGALGVAFSDDIFGASFGMPADESSPVVIARSRLDSAADELYNKIGGAGYVNDKYGYYAVLDIYNHAIEHAD